MVKMVSFHQLMDIVLALSPDMFIWGLTTSRNFKVKSMYLDLMNEHTRLFRKHIWKIKTSLKTKIFTASAVGSLITEYHVDTKVFHVAILF